MNDKLRKGLKIGGLVLALGALGKGCQNFNASSREYRADLAKPTNVLARIASQQNPEVRFYFLKDVSSDMPNRGYAWDINNDGIVDAIGDTGMAKLYSSDWKGSKYSNAQLMSPKTRELASQYFALSRELSRQIYLDALAEQPSTAEQAKQ